MNRTAGNLQKLPELPEEYEMMFQDAVIELKDLANKIKGNFTNFKLRCWK
jgi:hypothetical protein